MNVRRLVSILTIVMFTMTTFIPSYVEGGGNTFIELSPPKYLSDNRFSVEVSVRDVFNLYGLSAVLRYKLEELFIEEIVPGDFLSGDFEKTSIDNENGKSLYIETKTGKKEGISGDGILFSVIFRSHVPLPCLDFHEIFSITLSDDSARTIHFYMTDNPSLWISKLPKYSNNPHLTISGGYKGEINNILVNDISAEINHNDKTFSAPVTLDEGENIIEICGQDILGEKVYILEETLILDTVIPRIHIESPKGTVYTKTIRIKGRVEDDTGIEKFFIDGSPTQLDGGYFDVPVVLENNGTNKLTLKAVDKAGNISIREIEIYYKKDKKQKKLSDVGDLPENEPINQEQNIEFPRDYMMSMFEGHWAENHIKDLSKYNISFPIMGKELVPDESITDIEFAHLLESAIKYLENSNIKIAERISIGRKKLNGDFVTRNELALILLELLNLKEGDEHNPPYKDLEYIPEIFTGAVKSVSRQGLMIGFSDGFFRGEQNATRAQGAAVILRIIRYLMGGEILPDRVEKRAIIETMSMAESEPPLIVISPESDVIYTNQDKITLEGEVAEGYNVRISDTQHLGHVVRVTEREFNIEWDLEENSWHEIQINYYIGDKIKGSIRKWVVYDIYKPNLSHLDSSIPEEGAYISSWGSASHPISVKISDQGKTIYDNVSGIDENAFEVRLGELKGNSIKKDIAYKKLNYKTITYISSMEKGLGNEELENLSDGEYELVVSFSDNAGNTDGFTRKFYVDRTVPTVEIDYPKEGDTVSGIVTVCGTVYDTNISKYSLHIEGHETPSVEGTSNIEDGILGQIDTSAMECDSITIILEAVDKAGNTSSTHITVNVDNSLEFDAVNGNVALQHKGEKEGIIVYLVSGEDSIHTVTDSEGNFSFEVSEPGDYILKAVHKGYLSYVEDVCIGGDSHTDIQATLLAGDLNSDGIIDKDDLLILIQYFFISQDDEDWNQNFDFNGDGKVDILDIVITALNIDI